MSENQKEVIQMINRNNVAKIVAAAEGKKIQVNIAQIKEVQKCVLKELSRYPDDEILGLISKIRKGK
jgi:hypothetical protein